MPVLPLPDFYGRQVTRTDSGGQASYSTPDGATAGSFPVSDAYADTYAYGMLLSQAPADYTGDIPTGDVVAAFVRAIVSDQSLANSTVAAALACQYSLSRAASVNDLVAIQAAWGRAVAYYQIPEPDQVTARNIATRLGIAGF